MTTHHVEVSRAGCCAIEQTETVEHYLKALFDICSDGGSAGTAEVAQRLGVSSPSVTAMLARLRTSDLVEQAGWGRVILTQHGHSHALALVRRHRLLETFLHDVLGIGWEAVHTEAALLEHGLSARVEDLIDHALDHPARDPHGDPIPPKNGHHDEGSEVPLAHARQGDRFRVLRVRDRNSSALQVLSELQIGLGAEFELLDPVTDEGSRSVRMDGQLRVLRPDVVHALRGEIVPVDACSP